MFQNVPSWPLGVCGKGRETKVHIRRDQFCQSEEKQTACVMTPRLAQPTRATPPWQGARSCSQWGKGSHGN